MAGRAPGAPGPATALADVASTPHEASRSLWSRVRQLRGPQVQDMRVVEEPVEQRGHGGGVAEELAPVLDRTIGRDQRRHGFVAAHDDLES